MITRTLHVIKYLLTFVLKLTISFESNMALMRVRDQNTIIAAAKSD